MKGFRIDDGEEVFYIVPHGEWVIKIKEGKVYSPHFVPSFIASSFNTRLHEFLVTPIDLDEKMNIKTSQGHVAIPAQVIVYIVMKEMEKLGLLREVNVEFSVEQKT